MFRYHNALTGGAMILLGIGLYLSSLDIMEFGRSAVGADFMPKLCAVLLVALGALLLLGDVRRPKAAPFRPRPIEGDAPTPKEDRPLIGGGLAVIVSLVLMLAYVAALPVLGYILCSALYIFVQILIISPFRRARLPLYLGISVAVAAGSYALFVLVFQVTIPAGLLG
ncbi:tripartite tricarboxylate transporter TctB family protein [Thioclava sp. GXIMD2076]|uniref:tripartite tricarboxylate transporter TctB family protein n=1 Tax=unclassified Thioclava TaxID=2621713 RepID=UPI0030D22694